MWVKKWNFTNFKGVKSQSTNSKIEIFWLRSSNRILVEGVFATGDENHQVTIQNIIEEKSRIIASIGVNRVKGDFIVDISRYVPYELELEVSSSLPDADLPEKITVIHEDTKGNEKNKKEKRIEDTI